MSKNSIGSAWSLFIKFCFSVAAIYLGLIVVGTIWDVIARNSVFDAPEWLGTFVEFGLPVATMLAAPQLVRERRHVSMEIIDMALKPHQLRILIILTDIAATAICLFISYYASTGLIEAVDRNEVLRLAIDVPKWIFFALLVTGFSLSAIEFARHAWIGISTPYIKVTNNEGSSS